MKFKKGDIVLVDFPFTDLNMIKKRPALVVSDIEGRNEILCQITTKSRSISKYEVKLFKKDIVGDIKFDSNIYVDVLFTIHSNRIYKKIGELSGEVWDDVSLKLKSLF